MKLPDDNPYFHLIGLLPHQRNAITNIKTQTAAGNVEACETIRRVLTRSGIDERSYYLALQQLYTHGRIHLHFHPERLTSNQKTVAEGLLLDGRFRNQYETRISNGSPTAFPGGERDEWERICFGGCYHFEEVPFSDRPKYGALDLLQHPDGACPRFGSCYFVLKPEVSKRSTYTLGGNQDDLALEKTGCLDSLHAVFAPLLLHIEQGLEVLGLTQITVAHFLEKLSELPAYTVGESWNRPLGNALDSFVEAQIHGSIDLLHDIDLLVADPSFRTTPIEATLAKICFKYKIDFAWHPGYELPVDEVPELFRGHATRSLAKRIAKDGILNAAKIGKAWNSYHLKPELWPELGPRNKALTSFRRVWHVLVKLGYGQ